MSCESSARTKTETASPGMAGCAKEYEGGAVMLVRRGPSRPKRDLERREALESGWNGPEGRHERAVVGALSAHDKAA